MSAFLDYDNGTSSAWNDEDFNATTPIGECNDSVQADGFTNNPYIPSWYLQIVYVIAFATMVVVAAGGNVIVIWIVLGHRRMRTVTNYFLVNLAVADTLITVFNTMFNFIFMLYSDWPFGRLYCKFTQFIAPCTIAASVFTFMAIAIDRYMVIIHPLKPRIGAVTVLAVICIIWIAAIAIAFPNLPYATTHTWVFCNGGQRTICYLDWPDGQHAKLDFWYTTVLLLVTYIVPLVALAVTYARVGVELWGSRAIGERTAGQEESAKSKRKIVKMMMMVVLIFAACWLPQHIYYFVVNMYPYILYFTWTQPLYLAIYWLAMSNAMYNPIIYCWMNARFRSGFKYALRWLPCVRWYPSDAFGFWGFTAVRSCSLTDHQATRFSTLATPGGIGHHHIHHQHARSPHYSPGPPGCVGYEMSNRSSAPMTCGCSGTGHFTTGNHRHSLLVGGGTGTGTAGETVLQCAGGGESSRIHGGRILRSSLQQDRSSMCAHQRKYSVGVTASGE